MTGLRLALGVFVLGLAGCTVPSRLVAERPEATGADLVVLVHGMGRTPHSMIPMEQHLARAGFRVLNFGYSSVGLDVATLGRRLAVATDGALAETPARRVHFVGHSLGGIVIRWMLAHERPDRAGRVVLLAPPNQGAASADRMAPLVGWFLRPIRELRTADQSTAQALPSDPGVPTLIVAGARDRKVSLAESRLEGAEAHVVVSSGHTLLLMRPSVMRLVECYLASERPVGAAPTYPPAQATVTSSE